jgi:hypothetical protein
MCSNCPTPLHVKIISPEETDGPLIDHNQPNGSGQPIV